MNIKSFKNNNVSFGKIRFDFKNAIPTNKQVKAMDKIIENPELTCKLIKDLEDKNTDIYIATTREGSEQIALRLYTDVDWFGKKIIPYGKFNTKMETFINPDFDSPGLMDMRVSNFFHRANYVDLNSEKNLKEINNTLYGENRK